MRKLVLICLLTSSVVVQAQTVIPLTGILGPLTNETPEQVQWMTVPETMADVDSMAVHLTGTLSLGTIQCAGDDALRPFAHWPDVFISFSERYGGWQAHVPNDVPPGPFDVTCPFGPYNDVEMQDLAGVNARVATYIFPTLNFMCALGEMPTAEITGAELLLWPSITPVRNDTWSAIKGIFR